MALGREERAGREDRSLFPFLLPDFGCGDGVVWLGNVENRLSAWIMAYMYG